MAIVFTDWNSSDDPANAAILWADEAAIRGYPRYIHGEALRQALVERCTVTSTAIPAALQVAIGGTHNPCTLEWYNAFNDTITTLIPKFVNREDSGGNWNNTPDGPPAWTEATILTHCTTPTRITMQLALASWALQQYEILDHLRWTWRNGITGPGTQHQRGFGYAATMTVAVDAAIAQFLLCPQLPLVDYPGGSTHWSLATKEGIASRTSGTFNLSGISNAYWHGCDVYAFAGLSLPGIPGATITWDSEGHGWVQDTWALLEPLAEAQTTTRVSSTWGYDPLVPPPKYPSGDEGYHGWWLCNGDDPAPKFILKWDVAGGFTFVT